MLVEMAIGDAYGAGREALPVDYVRANNKLDYIQHTRWKTLGMGAYTDDTQMAIGLAEFLLSDLPKTPERLADYFVKAYKRDPHAGYMPGFRGLLDQMTDGRDFLSRILPFSKKSGGAMRAAPCGLIADRNEAIDMAMFQASLTHATRDGLNSAAASALLVWLCRDGCLRDKLGVTIRGFIPGYAWDEVWKWPVPVDGIPVVRAAITAVSKFDSLSKVLRTCISFGGDTDTVAAVAMPAAAMHPFINPDLPESLYEGLENGTYGREYLELLDWHLFDHFKVTPPHGKQRPTPLPPLPTMSPKTEVDLDEVLKGM